MQITRDTTKEYLSNGNNNNNSNNNNNTLKKQINQS